MALVPLFGGSGIARQFVGSDRRSSSDPIMNAQTGPCSPRLSQHPKERVLYGIGLRVTQDPQMADAEVTQGRQTRAKVRENCDSWGTSRSLSKRRRRNRTTSNGRRASSCLVGFNISHAMLKLPSSLPRRISVSTRVTRRLL